MKSGALRIRQLQAKREWGKEREGRLKKVPVANTGNTAVMRNGE